MLDGIDQRVELWIVIGRVPVLLEEFVRPFVRRCHRTAEVAKAKDHSPHHRDKQKPAERPPRHLTVADTLSQNLIRKRSMIELILPNSKMRWFSLSRKHGGRVTK
jgi:hypothetical protein